MKRKIWLPKDLIGSRNPTDSEHRAIYSFMQKEYQQKKKRTYTISLILAAIGSILLIIGMLANKNVPLLLISVLLLALGLVEAMTAHAYYIREQTFRDGKYQVVDGHIYNTRTIWYVQKAKRTINYAGKMGKVTYIVLLQRLRYNSWNEQF